MSHVDFLVTLHVPPSLEDAVVDCLLTMETAPSFTSYPINAHDHQNAGFSAAEQVIGSQRKIRFQLYGETSTIAELLNRLKANFSGAQLEYWVVPLTEHGVI